MGPLCGKCKREDPLSYMKDSRCYHCEGGEVAVVVSVIVMFFAIPLAVALILYRFTRARALTTSAASKWCVFPCRALYIGSLLLRMLACVPLYHACISMPAVVQRHLLTRCAGVGELPNYGHRELECADRLSRAVQDA